MSQIKHPLFRATGKFLLEILAVVIGVSLAFFADNLRESRNALQTEKATLNGLKSDIVNDTFAINSTINNLKLYISSYENLLANGFSQDSAGVVIDRLITYSAYRPVDVTYKEMQQSGAAIISNKKLLYNIITLNTKVVGLVDEAVAIDRNFVLERMIPFFEKNAAFPYNLKVDHRLMLNNEFKNLVQTSILYKKIDLTILNSYKQISEQLIKEIDEALEVLRK